MNCRNFQTKHQSIFHSNLNSKLNFEFLISIFFFLKVVVLAVDSFFSNYFSLLRKGNKDKIRACFIAIEGKREERREAQGAKGVDGGRNEKKKEKREKNI